MNAQQSTFLKTVVPAAQATQRKWGVPSSVTIAQAICESSDKQGRWGQSALARVANNYFGIKAVAHADAAHYAEFATHEFVDGRSTSQMARFARYASPSESFLAHGTLLALTGRYQPAMAAARDVPLFCEQLQACGYSTNPHYAETLMKLIRQYDLTQYDLSPDAPASQAAA